LDEHARFPNWAHTELTWSGVDTQTMKHVPPAAQVKL